MGRILAIVLCLLLFPAPALALYGDSEGDLGLDGSLRLIVLGLDNFDFPDFFGGNDQDFLAQAILRLTAMGHPSDRLAYEVHLVQSVTYTTAQTGGGDPIGTGQGNQRYRALQLEIDQYDEEGLSSLAFLDRLNVKLTFDWADLTLGRQAITFGKAYFWNPLDEFSPFDPSQFDRDYKAGADAARLDIPLGGFSGLNLVAAAGRTIESDGSFSSQNSVAGLSWYGSALLLRAFTNQYGYDWALQGGKVYGGYQLGGALVGDIGVYQVRLEAAYVWAVDSPALPGPLAGDLMESHLKAVIGLGRRFESSLQLESELFYNGAGDSGDLRAALARVGYGSSLQMSRLIWGLRASYEISPLLAGSWVWLVSLDDSSWQTQPSLIYSLSDNSELICGLTINRGDRPGLDRGGNIQPHSEFGSFADFVFFELKWYF
jgi:hypothetical protein